MHQRATVELSGDATDLLETVSDHVILLDRQWRFVYVNRAALERARHTREELLGRTIWEAYPELLGTSVESAYRRAVAEHVTVHLEAPGAVSGRWYDIHAYPARDGLMIYGRDVTDRKRAEQALAALNAELERRVEERTAALLARTRELEAAEAQLREREAHLRDAADHNARLARELEHRVGNHLAGLLTLVTDMRHRRAEPRELARAMEGRLTAMAHANRLLGAAGWRPVGWRSLVESLLGGLGPAAPHPCPTSVSGPDAAVDPKQATALAMILAEWFTNSCKYGPHSVPGGRLDVCAHGLAAGPDNPGGPWIRLTWREGGGPPVHGPVTPSLGTELVRGFASRELRGRCALSFPRGGAEHSLEFPVTGEPPAADIRVV